MADVFSCTYRVDIANELNLNAILRDCLAREIVLGTDPPTIVVEDL